MAKKSSSSSSVLQQPLTANNFSSQSSTVTNAHVQEMKEFPSLEGRPLPTVHVNNASLGEIKLALDEAVKKIISTEHQFTQSHTHTDVRLALGWTSVLIAAGTMGYGYKFGFEQTKGMTMLGVFCYAVLAVMQVAYGYYVEGQKIYVGKRKSLSKRIETETLQVTSTNLPSASSRQNSIYTPPRYSLTLLYRRSTNANKSLLRLTTESSAVDIGRLVDEDGGIEEERVKDWVGAVMSKAVGTGGVGVEEEDGKRK